MAILQSKMLKTVFAGLKCICSVFWAKTENEIFWLLRGVAVTRGYPLIGQITKLFFLKVILLLYMGRVKTLVKLFC